MPELPEIETICKGIVPYILDKTIKDVIIRERKLRWPIPIALKRNIKNHSIKKLHRRAKYLLFYMDNGHIILHLGMSGSLHILNSNIPHKKHDHVDIIFESGLVLRLRDPRKFGSILWSKADPMQHPLICNLGPEPLGNSFDADYLFKKSCNRTQSIKTFIMDARTVVGLGNIYANEALFLAKINPNKKAGSISRKHYDKLVMAIKKILILAIKKGGTTLRDFINCEGKPGYFINELQVYGRGSNPCFQCGKLIKLIRLHQRATYYCPHCQK